jgi:hypothetical protein
MQKDVPIPATPPKPTPALAMDSAEHILAAAPVLMLIAKWAGKYGSVYIKRPFLSGKEKDAKRNATIIATSFSAAIILLLTFIVVVVMWLAQLP